MQDLGIFGREAGAELYIGSTLRPNIVCHKRSGWRRRKSADPVSIRPDATADSGARGRAIVQKNAGDK